MEFQIFYILMLDILRLDHNEKAFDHYNPHVIKVLEDSDIIRPHGNGMKLTASGSYFKSLIIDNKLEINEDDEVNDESFNDVWSRCVGLWQMPYDRY